MAGAVRSVLPSAVRVTAYDGSSDGPDDAQRDAAREGPARAHPHGARAGRARAGPRLRVRAARPRDARPPHGGARAVEGRPHRRPDLARAPARAADARARGAAPRRAAAAGGGRAALPVRPAPAQPAARRRGGVAPLRRQQPVLLVGARPEHGLHVRGLRLADADARAGAGGEVRPGLPQARPAPRHAAARRRLRLGRHGRPRRARVRRRRRRGHAVGAAGDVGAGARGPAGARPARSTCATATTATCTETRLRRDQLDRAHRAHRHRPARRVLHAGWPRCCGRGGRLLNHCITRPDDDSPPISRRGFVPRYVFPDGELPGVGRLAAVLRRAPASSCATRRACASTTRSPAPPGAATSTSTGTRRSPRSGSARRGCGRCTSPGSQLGLRAQPIQLHQLLLVKPDADGRPACRCGRTGGCRGRSGAWSGPARRAGGPYEADGQARRRRRARNIASVPCRCGHSCTVGPSPRSGTPGSSGRASSCSSSGWRRSTSPTGHDGLGQVRRAGDVGQQPAGPQQLGAGGEQLALQPGQPGQVAGLPAPARLGTAPQRAQPAARGVEQHPVGATRAAAAGCASRSSTTARTPLRRTSRERGGAGPRAPAASRRARCARTSSSAALPPGPAHRSTQIRSGPSSGAAASASGDELAALVLHARPAPDCTAASAPGSPSARRTAYGDHGPGVPPLAATSCSRGSRRATRCTSGRVSSAASAAPVCHRSPPSASRNALAIHFGWLCSNASAARRSSFGASSATQAGEVLGGDLAQHGVHEGDRPGADDPPREVDGRGDGRVLRDPGAQQLVCAQAQDVEHGRVDLGERPVDARLQHRVVQALPAQGAVGQLGRQRRVAAVDAPLAQQPGQHEVGVGVLLADGDQHVVRRAARLVVGRRAVRALRRAAACAAASRRAAARGAARAEPPPAWPPFPWPPLAGGRRAGGGVTRRPPPARGAGRAASRRRASRPCPRAARRRGAPPSSRSRRGRRRPRPLAGPDRWGSRDRA